MPQREIVICNPVRTAIGNYGGTLKDTRLALPRSAKHCCAPAFSVNRVCGSGAVFDSRRTLGLPEGLDWIQAAAIPETFFTVWANLFRIGGATQGQRALIHGGTSGIGTTALMLCREFGIDAFATAGSEEKCAVIRELGAEAINYHDQAFDPVIAEKTADQGVNVILDIMGGSYFNNNVAALAWKVAW